MKQKCPYCEKYFKEILVHMSIQHEVSNLDEVDQKFKRNEIDDQKKEAFKKFTQELSEKHYKKEITGKEYRDEVKKWYDKEKCRDKNE